MPTEKQDENKITPLALLSTVLKGLKDYNVLELFKVLLSGFCIAIMIVLVSKPEVIFEWTDKVIAGIMKARDARHIAGTEIRFRAEENIRGELTGLLETTGADRAFLLEFHNGSSNLSSGLPFIFLDLTIDVSVEGLAPLREGEFKDLRTSQYPLVSWLLEKGYFYGTIDEVKELDGRLWHHLAGHDASEVAVLTLWNGQSASGFLGLSWHGTNSMDPEHTGRMIRAVGTKIAVELALKDRVGN